MIALDTITLYGTTKVIKKAPYHCTSIESRNIELPPTKCYDARIVNISFPSCISLIAVSLSFVAVSIFFFSFVAVSIFFFSYSISVIAVYPLILSKDLNYCLGLGLKGSDYDA
jgi:hypothetical protein